MITDHCEQGSEEWFAKRCGNPGASSFDKIITSTGKISAQRQKYLYQCAGEILTGQPSESYSNSHMERGMVLEQEARDLFEIIRGVEVKTVGLVYPDNTNKYHCSPDGLLSNESEGLEIKCPSLPVAVEYLDKGILPTEYKIQIQGSLMVTGLSVWNFMSYYPGLKPLILRIERDESLITQIRSELDLFVEDLGMLVKKLTKEE